MKSKGVNNPPDKVLLLSRFRDPHRFLLFGRARLYRDRILFSGLSWKGWYRRTIRLGEVDRVKWWAGDKIKINFALYLHGDAVIKAWVAASGLWKYQVEACLGLEGEHRSKLPGQMIAASAA